MAIAGQSAGRQHAIGAAFKSVEHLNRVQPACAGYFDNLDSGRILYPQLTGQIRGRIGAVTAAERDNLRRKFGWGHWLVLS
jgi:hypothetical protein